MLALLVVLAVLLVAIIAIRALGQRYLGLIIDRIARDSSISLQPGERRRLIEFHAGWVLFFIGTMSLPVLLSGEIDVMIERAARDGRGGMLIALEHVRSGCKKR